MPVSHRPAAAKAAAAESAIGEDDDDDNGEGVSYWHVPSMPTRVVAHEAAPVRRIWFYILY